MRLGISSYTYGWAMGTEGDRPADAPTALDLVDRAAGFGVRVLQLCDNLPEQTWRHDAVENLAAKARAAGVALEVGTRGTDPAHLRRFIDIAMRLGSPILRLVIDTPTDRPPDREVTRRIGTIGRDLEAAQVTLAIENHDRFPAAELGGMVFLLRECGIPVGVCLDTANSFGAGEGYRVVLSELRDWVVNLHLKDFAVTRLPHMQGFTIEGRPAGSGMLDIPWVLDRLKGNGRDPSVILELWTPPAADREATIRKEAAWARQSVEAVRQWVRE
jgi:sugar phosphate isomerase/epimerase